MSDETPDTALPFSDVWRQMELEIERLRTENEKLREVLKEVSVCLDDDKTVEDILIAVSDAAAAIRESGE